MISDRTANPPLLCLAQYFGTEDQLHGGKRTVLPSMLYLLDFYHNSWRVIDRHVHRHAPRNFFEGGTIIQEKYFSTCDNQAVRTPLQVFKASGGGLIPTIPPPSGYVTACPKGF